jgi:hypothetical protein
MPEVAGAELDIWGVAAASSAGSCMLPMSHPAALVRKTS